MRSPDRIEAEGWAERSAMLHRRINDLETAVTGLLRGPYQRTSSMAVTFACLVMGHPSKHDDEDAGCFCTIRKAP